MKYFFASTSNQDFFDIENNIIYAGDWCFDIDDKKIRKNDILLKYKWSDANDVYAAQIKCKEIYKYILPKLAKEINDYTGLKNTNNYYHILLGNWLMHFVHQAYSKYDQIIESRKYGNIYSWCLDNSDYQFPSNFNEFSSSQDDDNYQLQIYSSLFKLMEIPHELKKLNKINKKIHKSKKNNLRKLLLNSINFFYSLFKGRNKINIINPRFRKNNIINQFIIFINSRSKIIFDNFDLDNKFDINIDHEYRFIRKKNSKDIKDIIFNLVLINVPSDYLENHVKYLLSVKKIKVYKNNSYYTCSDIWMNSNLQFFFATNYEKINIFTSQHGIGYGQDKIHIGEDYEKSIAKIFLTFGWRDSKKTIPIHRSKCFSKKHNYKKFSKILFVKSARQRFLFRFKNGPTSSKLITDYYHYPLEFFKNTTHIDYISIRPHPVESFRKWNFVNNLLKNFPNIKLDKQKNIYKSLSDTRIFLSDHLGTSFLESIEANIPSFLILNKSSYKFRDDFIDIFNELVKLRIIFFSPEKASHFIDKNYKNIDSFWEDQKIQSLRKKLINSHYLTSNNWTKEFINTLLDI